jgi:salicylate hydroxylase
MDVAVIGGGIGGLAAALALARGGHAVAVYEQAEAFAEIGAGVQLSPNAVRALRWLGVEAALAAHVGAPEAIDIRRWRGDALLARSPLGESLHQRHGAPYWHVLRSDLHRILLDAAQDAGVRVHTGKRLQGAAPVRAGVLLGFDDGETVRTDLAVGADGVRSILRRSLGRADARFTGQAAWRGVVPVGRLPAETQGPVASVRVGPGRHFVSYPVAGGEAVNFVGVVEQAGWTAEGWSEAGDPAQLAADFQGWPAPVQAMIAACGQPWRWALLDGDADGLWTRDRIVLLGDAAHPVPPFLAQGAALALEDAVVLARRLAAAPVDAALRAYVAARRPRAARVLRASRRNAFAFHAREPLASLGQAALWAGTRAAPDALGRSLDWLYGYDPAVA